MRYTKTQARLLCCIAVGLATTALAAQQTTTRAPQKAGDLDQIRKVSTLIGTDVMNRTNAKVAVLRDLALSREGAVLYAVLGYGGVAGVGETYTAAPFDLMGVHHENGKWAINLDMTYDDLKKAPVLHSENYRELTDAQWMSRVDEFFRAQVGSQKRSPEAGGADQRERRPVERVLLATKIRAAKLMGNNSQELGKVEDLLLDRMYRVAFVIVGRGGVLGVGENYIPIPWSKLVLRSDPTEYAMVTAVIDTTKAELEKAPLVKGGNYATLLAPGFADQVREFFAVSERGTGSKDR